MNFYHGEANVFQESLDSFILAIAEELQLKGLIGKTDEKVEKSLSSTFSPAKIPKTAVHRQALNRNIHNLGENGTLAIPGNNSGDFEELDNEVNSMMLKSQNRSANGHQFADIIISQIYSTEIGKIQQKYLYDHY